MRGLTQAGYSPNKGTLECNDGTLRLGDFVLRASGGSLLALVEVHDEGSRVLRLNLAKKGCCKGRGIFVETQLLREACSGLLLHGVLTDKIVRVFARY